MQVHNTSTKVKKCTGLRTRTRFFGCTWQHLLWNSQKQATKAAMEYIWKWSSEFYRKQFCDPVARVWMTWPGLVWQAAYFTTSQRRSQSEIYPPISKSYRFKSKNRRQKEFEDVDSLKSDSRTTSKIWRWKSHFWHRLSTFKMISLRYRLRSFSLVPARRRP